MRVLENPRFSETFLHGGTLLSPDSLSLAFVRDARIGLAPNAWEALVLPLN